MDTQDCVENQELKYMNECDIDLDEFGENGFKMYVCEKATAYDRLMSGGKKTLKEWANFLGKIVVVHRDGRASWHEILPDKNEQWGIWVARTNKDNRGDIPKDLILFDGDWKDSLTLPDGWEESK